MLTAETDRNHDAELWAAFDRAQARRALTRDELAAKLRQALWALAERGCPEQAEGMLKSALADIERASG